MRFHLLLSVSLFHLSRGFMAELSGPIHEETCTGEEYADFQFCALQGAAADSSIPELHQLEQVALVTHHGRHLGICGGCRGGAPRGTFCFTWCGRGRRLLQEGTGDVDNTAIYTGGEFIGNGAAVEVAEAIIECLEGISTTHACLGAIETLTLMVHTALTSADQLFKSPEGCVNGRN
jgi:hypothetical protein